MTHKSVKLWSNITAFIVLFFATSAIAQKPVIEMVKIPAGSFTMGSPQSEQGREANEVEHVVMLNSFNISKYEVTVGQFKAFVDATGYITDAEKNGGGVIGSAYLHGKQIEYRKDINWRYDERGNLRPESEYNYPVIHISWNDANAFAKWIGYRLPSEAEWEYACRAGSKTVFNTGDCLGTEQSNFNGTHVLTGCKQGTISISTKPVNNSQPNAFGICNMHGNVWEWCQDWFGDYDSNYKQNPTGAEQGTRKVLRGGSWTSNDRDCRSANRNGRVPEYRNIGVGFRVAF